MWLFPKDRALISLRLLSNLRLPTSTLERRASLAIASVRMLFRAAEPQPEAEPLQGR